MRKKIAEIMLKNINGVLSFDNKKASRYQKHDTIIDNTMLIYDNITHDFVIIGVTSNKEIVKLDMSLKGVIVI